MGRSRHDLALAAAALALALLPSCHALHTRLEPAPGRLILERGAGESQARESVLYLESALGGSSTPDEARRVEVASAGEAFRPPLTVVRAGDEVRFVNGGAIAHRIFTTSREGRRERLVEPGSHSAALRIIGSGEHRFYCSLHSDESFVIFASPLRHFVVAKGERTHRIEGIRAGRYRVGSWSEAGARSLGIVEIRAGETATHVYGSDASRKTGAEIH